jgi:hypothetical protein
MDIVPPRNKWHIVESGVFKHHNQPLYIVLIIGHCITISYCKVQVQKTKYISGQDIFSIKFGDSKKNDSSYTSLSKG